MRLFAALLLLPLIAGCGREAAPPQSATGGAARSLLIVTIDTLRADRVGAYGYLAARTPVMDGVAARGVRFERAYATAPITLTSHASLMTGRYPPGHGARHNGMRMDLETPTLADTLSRQGFETAAFVGAFPLDRRFGLIKGFATYGDRMPRGLQGRLENERPAREVADEAVAWLDGHRSERFFLWVHFFEPHAPYGTPGDRRPIATRYDEEIAEADRQAGRVIEALADAASSTLIVITADHGEAFGEHGEIAHSVFVYDTTLRVPLLAAGPGIARRVVAAPVSLIDIPATAARLLGIEAFDTDGIDLTPVMSGRAAPVRDLYAESFAPLLDFGWSPLRTLRREGFKYIAAPRPELYDLRTDPVESRNLAGADRTRAAAFEDRIQRISSAWLESAAAIDADAAARLQALGYTSRGAAPDQKEDGRPDPKDKRELAARIARVTSGELEGQALESALRRILKEDSANPQAHVRLGHHLLETGRCGEATEHFERAIAASLPGADAHLGLGACLASARQFARAAAVLHEGVEREPDNPVVIANQGVVLSDAGRPLEAVPFLQRALTLDPDFHQARFNLAIAFGRAGRRDDAARQAEELLRRMPADSPQRSEVERLLAAVR